MHDGAKQFLIEMREEGRRLPNSVAKFSLNLIKKQFPEPEAGPIAYCCGRDCL